MRLIPWILGGALLALAHASTSAAAGTPACTIDGLVCLVPSPLVNGRGVELWVESRRPGALTISLEQNLENLSAVVAAPAELSLAGPGRRHLASLRAVREDLPWKQSFQFRAVSGVKGAVHDDAYAYALPLEPGTRARVSQGFHGRFSHHDLANQYGIDFELPEGTPVYAAREGLVVEVEQEASAGGPAEALTAANAVRVQHADGTVAEYGHLRFHGAAVRVGQSVRRGELLAYSGNTGRSTGPHLHFDVHVPVSGRQSRSLPVRFQIDGGAPQFLEEGVTYQRP